LIAIGGDLTTALFDASMRNIPVVGGVSDDRVRMGLAPSLTRPGKNFTDVTFLTNDLAAQRGRAGDEAGCGDIQSVAPHDELTFARKAAQSLSIEKTSHRINSAGDLDAALRSAKDSGANSLFVIASRLTGLVVRRIA